MQNLDTETKLIFQGRKCGILTVGDLVFDVASHPQYLTTPRSYISHGRLRECLCACGQTVLYSENALTIGGVKSCGCLRLKKRAADHDRKAKADKVKGLKQEINLLIKQAQSRLRISQTKPSHLRGLATRKQEEQLGAQLRKLFQLKGYAGRAICLVDTLANEVLQAREEFHVSQPQ
jgi:hypothetical protein